MAELFGSPNGRSLAEADMAREAMLGPQMLHSVMSSTAIPAQIAQHQAQARYLNARGEGLEVDAAVNKQVAAMARDADWSPSDRANPGWKFAELYAAAGDPTKAMKIAGQAATIDQKVASAATNEDRARLIQARTRITQMDELARQVRSVDGPEALQTILQRYTATTGEQTGMLDAQGNLLPAAAENWEKIKGNIETEALSEKDKVAIDYRNRALDSAERERTSRQSARTFWQDMDNQRKRAEAQATGRGVKTGADVLSKAEGKTMAANYLNSLFVAELAQAKVLGADLAERAQQLRAKNPALTPQEAIKEAFKSMDSGGKFEGMQRKPQSASPDKPLTLPADGDRTKLKVGQYYSDGKNVRQWLGPEKGFGGPRTSGRIGAGSVAATVDNEPDDDLENEETDDEMALE